MSSLVFGYSIAFLGHGTTVDRSEASSVTNAIKQGLAGEAGVLMRHFTVLGNISSRDRNSYRVDAVAL